MKAKDFRIKELGDYWNILFKRWELSLVIFVIMFSSVVFLTIRQEYVYQASTKILIGESLGQRALGNSIDSFQNYFFQQQEFATQPYIIRSKPVAEAVANRLNWVSAEKDPHGHAGLVGMIRGSINIERVEESRLFSITSTHSDPEKAQQIANAAAEVFIERNLEKKLNAFKKSIAWLTDQLIDLEAQLEESQKELISYIEAERVTNFGDQAILPNSISADQDLSESRGMLQRLNSKKIEQELELANLSQRYTEKHPKVVRAREELALTRGKLAAEDKSMRSRDEQRESEAIRGKQKEIKYSILKRKVDINKELYNSLIQKMKEIDIASAVNDNNIDILEYAAVPSSPLRPNKTKQFFLGLIVALVVSIGAPILLDYIDPTLRTAEEVEQLLSLPVLSSIPIFENKTGEPNQRDFPALNTRSTEAEAFRILRTNIRFSFPADGGHCLLVTSSGPGEGKSTIATNLALTMAAAGSKTCLVDTDLRIPRLHKMFGVSNDCGLTNYLVGEEANIDNVIQKSEFENLYLIPSGISSPKPAELLETQEMLDTVKLLLEKFDRVIFDSPPAGNLVDASILATHMDGVIFVLQSGKVSKTHIKLAKEQLDRVKANICGVVLNKIVISKSSYYYYYMRGKGEDAQNKKDATPTKRVERG